MIVENAAATLGNASSAASRNRVRSHSGVCFVSVLLRVFPGFPYGVFFDGLIISACVDWFLHICEPPGFLLLLISSFIPLGSGNTFFIILNVLRLY